MIAALSERRKADRATMARLLSEIAAKHGGAALVCCDADEVTIEIEHPSGMRCYVWLSRSSPQPGVYVIPWHLGFGCTRRLASSFGEVNPFHQRKATHVAHGWEALATEIERGLAAAADGTAYEADKEKS